MRPAELAAKLCALRSGNFADEVEAHLLTGYVFSGPDYFLLGKAVPRSADVGDLFAVHDPAECDAWFVWCGIGDAARLLALMPHDLPWIGWHRQGRAWRESHWTETARLRRKLKVDGF